VAQAAELSAASAPAQAQDPDSAAATLPTGPAYCMRKLWGDSGASARPAHRVVARGRQLAPQHAGAGRGRTRSHGCRAGRAGRAAARSRIAELLEPDQAGVERAGQGQAWMWRSCLQTSCA